MSTQQIAGEIQRLAHQLRDYIAANAPDNRPRGQALGELASAARLAVKALDFRPDAERGNPHAALQERRARAIARGPRDAVQRASVEPVIDDRPGNRLGRGARPA